MPKKIIDSQPQLVDALKSNNETLQNIDRGFIQIMSRYHIYFFHEGKPTNLKGTLRFVSYPWLKLAKINMCCCAYFGAVLDSRTIHVNTEI